VNSKIIVFERTFWDTDKFENNIILLIPMGRNKIYSGYKAYHYLEPYIDYEVIEYREPLKKEWAYNVPLSGAEEDRFEQLIEKNIVIDLHEHPVQYAKDLSSSFYNQGRERLAYEALSKSGIDCIFDNMMDGSCNITSKHGNKWTDVIQNLGMRLCDIANQDFVIHCKNVNDITTAFETGRLAWVAVIETLNCIENEVDRIDVLQGLGIRSSGITYSEANMLGSGLKEPGDSGLTDFGYDCVVRMNKVGMLIDVSHCGDKTALDSIESSKKPIIISHCGSRTVTPTTRMLTDEILHACADKGGVLGVEMAGAIVSTEKHPVANLEAYMDQIEYCIETLGINHIGFGPDTLYGDHINLYRTGAAKNKTKGMGFVTRPEEKGDEFLGISMNLDELPEYVKGMENPNESIQNPIRWMIKNGYSDEDIKKVMGSNALRVLKKVWPN
jgi:membrane dipeptidase